MTREEAIKTWLPIIVDGVKTMPELEEALEMAIKALEKEPCEDAISRADVKKYLSAPDANGDRVIYESDLDLLPSVTPSYNSIKTELKSCDDCISRQAVINAIANTCFWLSADNWEELTKCINSISPTTPQPKIGHWIEGQTDNPNIHNILCSCCFEGYPSKGHANSQYTKEKYRWCSNCRARMIESEG